MSNQNDEMIFIDTDAFLALFSQEYNFLYDNEDNVAGYDEAVKAFDEFASAHDDVVSEVVSKRGDFISSDREAAAFMFALESYLSRLEYLRGV